MVAGVSIPTKMEIQGGLPLLEGIPSKGFSPDGSL